MRWVILLIFIVCAAYTHWRGKVRHGFFRQLSDHSTFMSPVNGFVYLFSRVPSTPYLHTSLFPELAPLKTHWQTIRAEAMALHEASKIQAAAHYNDIGFNSFFRRGWRRFYLKWYDRPHPSAVVPCPQTLAILQGIPTVKAAMFAMLPPGGTLTLHRDPYAGSLRYHLGLVTPNSDGCAIVVDGERYAWRDGEEVVFDETFLHWAENKTDVERIILFCDIERPMKYRWAQAVNHVVGGFLMRAAASPNEVGDRTGGLNHAFKYLYSIRLVGKRLKAWNRTVYYIVKWLLFGGIAVAIFWRY
ncbi:MULTISPECIES: lipid A hydroxylase LpxO [unclassified Caballeronia]|uniref:lipid A hydroxylase LpxO n=1 Tax=unclassified Caballeronia TaxID=2646786 RepID=UPI0028652339|nr:MULTISPECIES: lipid A hydroxylase LpxO [unclassified Caballeronia]MDR5814051.1 lipid A hydroxylase LpxO [Caballeronia sp. LZ033]MDR5820638.1 lipid A hydroxylase LpxO [Caballeronia sp. LZ043]MDR5878592.1 lipid A hydroxylase LpxO [Caballeronia sp. LZ032]